MDSQYLQKQRFQLQKRVRRLNSCNVNVFHSGLVQFWNFLQSHVLFKAVLEKLAAEAPDHSDAIQKLNQGQYDLFAQEIEALHFAYRLIEHCAGLPLEIDNRATQPEVNFAFCLGASNAQEALEQFRDSFLDPVYEYLDESLDQTGATLSLLVKYRQRVEWFFRSEVASSATNGERKLAPHLYAYLHDQGLDFSIEPQGPSGIPDLVSRELVMDVKLFDGFSRAVSYVASGVHQVHTYLRDFEQVTGYLVIYKTCPDALHFAFASPDRHFPMLQVGGKIIFLVVIDICDHDASASKRGTLKEFNVDEATLIKQLEIDTTYPVVG